MPGEEKVEAERFAILPELSPLQGAQGFPEGSPLRTLGEAHWLGQNLFNEKCGIGKASQRIEISGRTIELREGEWLAWNEGLWVQGLSDDKAHGIARVVSADSRGLIVEGWDREEHAR